jgi:hypothetical protein
VGRSMADLLGDANACVEETLCNGHLAHSIAPSASTVAKTQDEVPHVASGASF